MAYLGDVVCAMRQLGNLLRAGQASSNVAEARQVLRSHHGACIDQHTPHSPLREVVDTSLLVD